MKPEIYFYITQSVVDEKRQIKNSFMKLFELYDNNLIHSDSILITPVKRTVTSTNFIDATSENVSISLKNKGYLKCYNDYKLILNTERSISVPSNIEAIVGLFVSDKLFSIIENYSSLKYIIIIPSETSNYKFWINKWQPINYS